MEIEIQPAMYVHWWKEWLDNDKLEAHIDYYAIYSKACWLVLIEERLNRIESEE